MSVPALDLHQVARALYIVGSHCGLDRIILGETVRERMTRHAGPYRHEPANKDGSLRYVCGAAGWNMLGVLLDADVADAFVETMNAAGDDQ